MKILFIFSAVFIVFRREKSVNDEYSWVMRKILHTCHLTAFCVLLVSGLLLHFPQIRGLTAPYRLLFKHVHAGAGVFFALTFAGYLLWIFFSPTLRQKNKTRISFLLLLIAMGAWTVTGMTLMAKSALTPVAVSNAFDFHMWLTYLSVPFIFFHVWISWTVIVPESHSAGSDDSVYLSGNTRRRFFGWLGAGISLIWIGSIIYRWLGLNRVQEVTSVSDCNVFIPAPDPAPASLPPIGGGYRGIFGEYSVANFLPCMNHETWSFRIDGLVTNVVNWDWADFARLPRKVQVSDFHCVEGWSVFGITYEGLHVSDLLDIAKINPEAKWVKFYSADGRYADTLTIEQARMSDVMIVLLMDGKPISRVLGGPARLIVPKMYAYKAVKWVVRMELIDEPYMGYWEFYGFDTDAWVEKQGK